MRELIAGRSVGVVLSGGNIDPRLLASVIMRSSGALGAAGPPPRGGARRARHPRRPHHGAGRAGANIVELAHDRMLLDVSARSAEIAVVVETYDHAHLERAARPSPTPGFRATLAWRRRRRLAQVRRRLEKVGPQPGDELVLHAQGVGQARTSSRAARRCGRGSRPSASRGASSYSGGWLVMASRASG